jgi:hypothetical protein
MQFAESLVWPIVQGLGGSPLNKRCGKLFVVVDSLAVSYFKNP